MLEAGKRKCKYCNRWFPNGKSLGGHMKSHLSLTYPKATTGAGSTSSSKPQSKSDQSQSQSQSQKKRKAPVSPTTLTGEDYNCKKCGKSFPCWRSYLGHIKWHQFVQNDPNNKTNTDDDASEDAEINRAAHLLIALSKMEYWSCVYFPGVNFEEGIGSEVMKKNHECSVCHEIFSTKKALGCHMKSTHMTEGVSKSKVVKEKRELGFDLNVVPPEDSGHPSDEE